MLNNWFRRSRITRLLALVMLSAWILVSCTPSAPATTPGSKANLTQVIMMLDWTPNTNHTGLFVAQAQGWYQDEGLDVQIIQPGQGGTPLQVVASGKADFGVSFQEEVTNARAQDVPVVSLAAIIQHNTSAFISVKDRGITRPKDFEGKKYGAFGLPLENQVLDVLMRCDGADPNKVTMVNIGSSDPLMAIQQNLDFVWIYEGWEGVEAGLRNLDVNLVRFSDWVKCLPDYYTPLFVTSETMLAQKPDVVRQFMAATAKGYQYAIDHPDEAAEILIKAAPEANPDLIRKSQAWLSPRYRAEAPRWGQQELTVWENYDNWLADRGLVSKKIDVSKAFTNDFLLK